MGPFGLDSCIFSSCSKWIEFVLDRKSWWSGWGDAFYKTWFYSYSKETALQKLVKNQGHVYCFVRLPWRFPQRIPSYWPNSSQRILFRFSESFKWVNSWIKTNTVVKRFMIFFTIAYYHSYSSIFHQISFDVILQAPYSPITFL